jgi:hypothetical protein
MSSHRDPSGSRGLLAFALLTGGQTGEHAALEAYHHSATEEAEPAHPNRNITDFYLFQKPDDPQKSLLIMNVNPTPPKLDAAFDPTASYEFLVDTNGDALPDLAFRVLFSQPSSGQQTASVVRAEGVLAREKTKDGDPIIQNAPVSFGSAALITTQGDYRFFAGLRSDPFFFDLMGFCNNFHFTGTDYFADQEVFGIVLEVPNSALGTAPKLGAWCRILVPQGGALVQVTRLGLPLVSILMNGEEDKPRFHHAEPSLDRTLFQAQFVSFLSQLGHSADQAQQVAQTLLPDILPYDYSSAAGFPNGRKLTDDVADLMLALVTNGTTSSDQVGPHNDYTTAFPYLGAPHGGYRA